MRAKRRPGAVFMMLTFTIVRRQDVVTTPNRNLLCVAANDLLLRSNDGYLARTQMCRSVRCRAVSDDQRKLRRILKSSTQSTRNRLVRAASSAKAEQRVYIDSRGGFDAAAFRRKTQPVRAIETKSFPVCRVH